MVCDVTQAKAAPSARRRRVRDGLHRSPLCALLGGHAGQGLGALRQAVGVSPGTVRISTGCLGGCAVGPLIRSTRDLPKRSGADRGRWFGPMHAGTTRTLVRWADLRWSQRGPLPAELAHVRLHVQVVADDVAET